MARGQPEIGHLPPGSIVSQMHPAGQHQRRHGAAIDGPVVRLSDGVGVAATARRIVAEAVELVGHLLPVGAVAPIGRGPLLQMQTVVAQVLGVVVALRQRGSVQRHRRLQVYVAVGLGDPELAAAGADPWRPFEVAAVDDPRLGLLDGVTQAGDQNRDGEASIRHLVAEQVDRPEVVVAVIVVAEAVPVEILRRGDQLVDMIVDRRRVAAHGGICAARPESRLVRLLRIEALFVILAHLKGDLGGTERGCVVIPVAPFRMLPEKLHDPESKVDPQIGVGQRLHPLGMQGRDARLDRRGAELRQRLTAPPAVLTLRRHEHHVVVRGPEGELGQRKAGPPHGCDKLGDILRLIVLVGGPVPQVPDLHRLVANIKPVARLAQRLAIFARSAQDRSQLVAILRLHRQLHRDQMSSLSCRGNLNLGIVQNDRLPQTVFDFDNEPRPLRRGHAVTQRDEHRTALLSAVNESVGLD